ncbi:Plipastatin synthase subunit A [Actinomadura rubteroloni]|uniref:Plipastatin synthase subunit A n=1 Tax=Actinomadura rubteroloni TaxID=1926885 RepID=A0A2P4UJZ9_9ACTN|nr:AMP-binding protein [Actinomadura rubteroloni]POM25375.1 Plipastatin synthase subunit A [Actinomadura rubteroloni]
MSGGDELVDGFLLASAGAGADRPAIVRPCPGGGFEEIGYGELRDRVVRAADVLGGLGLAAGDRVLIDSDTSAASVVALLACSRAGLTFVPVSPEMPVERVRQIVAATCPALVLAARPDRLGVAPDGCATGLLDDAGLRPLRAGPRRGSPFRAVPTDPAHIVFTSGTTGRPKGIVMSHRAVVAFFRGMLAQCAPGADGRVATVSPFQFDMTLLDLGQALGGGAALVPVPRGLLRQPRRFVRFLDAAGVTQVDGVPSVWRPVLRHAADELPVLRDRLRQIIVGGEAFPVPEFRRLRALLPRTRMVNVFGQSESIACSFGEIPDPVPDAGLPIGPAHPGAELMLLDERGAPVTTPGAVGEIHLRGTALFSGYWADPEATRAALVPDPRCPESGQRVFRSGDLARLGPDGALYFAGRRDAQVQIHGNRVEPGEIERRLLAVPGVEGAAVLAVDDAGGPALAAFVVTAPGRDVAAAGLRERCFASLPAYMVPRVVRFVERIPVNGNGKVDRDALAASLGRG